MSSPVCINSPPCRHQSRYLTSAYISTFRVIFSDMKRPLISKCQVGDVCVNWVPWLVALQNCSIRRNVTVKSRDVKTFMQIMYKGLHVAVTYVHWWLGGYLITSVGTRLVIKRDALVKYCFISIFPTFSQFCVLLIKFKTVSRVVNNIFKLL